MAEDRYAAIRSLPHHESRKHPRMPMEDRAAQFAPFAALTGYDAVIREAERTTDERISQDEELTQLVGVRLRVLQTHLRDAPEVSLTYFEPDGKKAGGAYRTRTGQLRKIDEYERTLILYDGTKIPLENILNIESELFSED